MKSEWWERCRFIRDYFLGPQRQIAHELAVRLATEWVGDHIYGLHPETALESLLALEEQEYREAVGSLLCEAGRDALDGVELLLAVAEETGQSVELTYKLTFRNLVRLVQSVRALGI